MKPQELENFEIDLLLEAIVFQYGYDFREYSRASLTRRIHQRLIRSHFRHVSDMIPSVLHDESFIGEFLSDMSITVTQMFRDPKVFAAIRSQVVPKLKSYARINVWNAGCATGEEAYSMAILLEEESLLNNTRIYATDFNNRSLQRAEKGIYAMDDMQTYAKNYLAAGGQRSFSDNYSAKYDSAKLNESLISKVTFANHNLTQDQVFAETHVVLCRNVLIYFNKTLQNRVLCLLRDSLVPRGFLILGDKESLKFSEVIDDFEVINEKLKIYRKKLGA